MAYEIVGALVLHPSLSPSGEHHLHWGVTTLVTWQSAHLSITHLQRGRRKKVERWEDRKKEECKNIQMSRLASWKSFNDFEDKLF